MAGLIPGFKGLVIPTSFTVSSSTQSVQIDHPYKILYELLPISSTNQTIIRETSNSSIATVSSDGTINPVSVGECTVTGHTASNWLTQIINVTTYVVHTTGVSLDQTSINLTPYEPIKLNATVVPESTNYPEITWSSSDANVATVDSDGLVTYVDTGNCTITVTTTDGGYTDTCSVTAIIPVEGVTLNKSSARINAGETLQLVATITPTTATIQDVIWTSSNDAIATVDNTGLVTYVADGNVTITCTTVQGGFTASCSIECYSFQPVDKCFGYTGAQQSILLQPHKYCLEVRGASGFCCAAYSTGRGGGYASGCITLTSDTCLYIYVGQHPTGQTGGWNGGGNGRYSYGMGGGGGTDIRIKGTSLCHRFIVAGGSGGNNCTLTSGTAQGGAGGGAYGMEAYYNTHYRQGCARSGGGAGPNYGGCAWSSGGSQGTFGQGGTSCGGYNAGGGGGGWYGGGGAYDNDSDNDGRGGGGGSGYTWTASTCSYHPSPACLSGVPYLTGAKCCPGCVSFPSPSGSTETGHFGHGCGRIRSID